MGYLAGLIIVALFFLALKYFLELSRKQELIISLILLAAIFSAVAFNNYNRQQREKMLEVVIKYNQNKTVFCNGVEVNKKNYSLSIGTYTFIGKKDTPNYAQMISASTCK
jgi:glutamine cyclotransferase